MDATRSCQTDPRIQRSRERVIAAATEILVEQGPRSCTVDAVAERSGVAKSTIYRHWNSRAELIVDVCHSVMPEPDLAPLVDGDFESTLRMLLHQLADSFSSPTWAAVYSAILSMRKNIPEVAELLDADRKHHIEMMGMVLDVGAAEGRDLDDIDPEMAIHLLVGPVLSATVENFAGSIHDLVDRSIDQFLAAHPRQ